MESDARRSGHPRWGIILYPGRNAADIYYLLHSYALPGNVCRHALILIFCVCHHPPSQGGAYGEGRDELSVKGASEHRIIYLTYKVQPNITRKGNKKRLKKALA